ncbi:MAG: hypothetical protein PUA97_06025 [bacterium]|nr:hypothetical protein [bacterium]
MKKKLLFVIAACAFFLPATVFAAKAPEYVPDDYSFYANGTPITIEARTDGKEGALIKWDGGEKNVAADTSVFAGAHNSSEVVENASITMNAGTIRNIIGGGEHKSIVKKVTITLNNGTVTGSIVGGGMRYGTNTHDDFTEPKKSEMNSRDDAITIVDEAIITINAGTIGQSVFGGGESYSYTGKATVTINSSFTGEIGYVTAGGSNGYTGEGIVYANGGKIKVLQAVNRGFMKTSELTVDGAEVEKAYASAEGDNQELGVTDSAKLVVISGKVGYAAPGQKGNPGQKANEISTIVYNDGTVTTVEDFNEDATTVTVNLMLIAGDEEQTIQIPKGTVFTDEELKAMIEEINNELAADNLELVGFYLDEKLTQEFDFSTPIEQDMELYMKLKDITPEQKVENPETSDVNIFLILSLVAVGAFGTTLVLKNRLS